MQAEIADLKHKLAMEHRLYLDQPEDRLYHASDRTWWRRDGKGGELLRADPPPEVERMRRALYEIAESAKPIVNGDPQTPRQVARIAQIAREARR